MRLGLLVAGLGACALLVAGELSPVLEIEIAPAGNCEIVADAEQREQCNPTGAERHMFALLVLAALGAVMTWGAAFGGSRPAAAALALVGVAALAIVLIGDAPDVNETGQLGLRFADAEANPARGFWLSLAGAALALLTGVAGLLASRRRNS